MYFNVNLKLLTKLIIVHLLVCELRNCLVMTESQSDELCGLQQITVS